MADTQRPLHGANGQADARGTRLLPRTGRPWSGASPGQAPACGLAFKLPALPSSTGARRGSPRACGVCQHRRATKCCGEPRAGETRRTGVGTAEAPPYLKEPMVWRRPWRGPTDVGTKPPHAGQCQRVPCTPPAPRVLGVAAAGAPGPFTPILTSTWTQRRGSDWTCPRWHRPAGFPAAQVPSEPALSPQLWPRAQ